MMNPETNRFEEVYPKDKDYSKELDSIQREYEKRFSKTKGYEAVDLVRKDGSNIPPNYSVFFVGEEFILKNYRYRVKLIKEDEISFEPVGPVSLHKIKTVVYSKKSSGSSKRKRKSGSKKKR